MSPILFSDPGNCTYLVLLFAFSMSADYLCYFVLNQSNHTARCKLCPDGKKNTYKFSKKSKTNLKAHLSSCHSREIEEKKEAIKSSNPFSLSAISNDEQAKITDAVVDFVIEDDQPISLPEMRRHRSESSWVEQSPLGSQ